MKKKKIAAIVLGAVLVAGLCGGAVWAAGNSETVLLKENQRYVYAYITSIQGNEITYMEVDESVVTALTAESENTENETETTNSGDFTKVRTNDESVDNTEDVTDENRGGMPDMGNMPSDGEMPDMGSMPSDGEMPDMGSMPSDGEMPDMGNMPSDGEMPDMSSMPDDGTSAEGGFSGGGRDSRDENSTEAGMQEKGNTKGNSMQFGNMSETITTYIPVGVTVHTAADVSTTFSRLASGDLVKILVETNDAEEDVIEEIWMLQ